MKARLLLIISGLMLLTVSCQFGQDKMDMTTKKAKVLAYIDKLYKSEQRIILSGQTTCHNQSRTLEAWDIVALDWYTNTVDDLNSDESYDRLVALGKPFGVSEFGPEKLFRDGSFDNLLIVKALTEGPWRSAFFIYWDSWTSRTDGYCHVAIMDNRNAQALMSHPKVINRDKVSWK